MTVTEALNRISLDFRYGYHEMEAGYPEENDLNDHQRDLIAAIAEANSGEVWLGWVNLYDETRGKPVIWKWDGGLVYNFGASFAIPRHDAELERLILERDQAEYTGTAADYERIKAIYARLEELGGHSLTWN